MAKRVRATTEFAGFFVGVVVTVLVLGAAFLVHSGLTGGPEGSSPLEEVRGAVSEVRDGPAAPQPQSAAPGAPAGSADRVAAPRPGSNVSGPDATAPDLEGTDGAGVAGLGLDQPSRPEGAPSGLAPGAPSATGAPEAPEAALPPVQAETEEEARQRLAELLGEAPPADATSSGPEAPTGGEAPATLPLGSGEEDPVEAARRLNPDEAAAALEAALAGEDPATGAATTESGATDATDADGSATPGTGAAASEAPAAPEVEAPAAPEAEPEVELALAGPALEVNARAVEMPEGVPAVAIVVSDAAADGGLSPQMLDGLAFPVTIGVVPGTEGAGALAEAARAAGHEVLVQLAMDGLGGRVEPAATLSDELDAAALSRRTERLLAAAPQGVAVSTYPARGPGISGGSMEAVLGVLAEHGFGYLENRPGGTAERSARTKGVAFAEVTRAVSASATESQVLQQMDTAVGDAVRDGPSVIVIPPSPQLLNTLSGWALKRGGSIRLVPLSAVLKARAAG